MHVKSGQAMIEFAICLLAFALVLSALLAFGAIIPKVTQIQNEVRREAGCSAQVPSAAAVTIDNLGASDSMIHKEKHATADIPSLAAQYFFDTNADNEFRIHEKASMPNMSVPLKIELNTNPDGGLL